MSKFVKELISKHLASELDGVSEALLVNVVGLEANKTVALRKQLRAKNIRLMVVKGSLARRATEGTPLGAAFQSVEGSLAVVFGSSDIVSLAKEVVRIAGDKQFEGFTARGGVMDGAVLTAKQVDEVSKWPSREEQLSLLVGQILSPGSKLASQLIGPGGAVASQVKKKSEGEESTAEGEPEPATA
ncbi:MAG: 50S ribosomal protein L10 [Planctomycetes bacterium]|nr:50S ribosomal protein L10 [Planctomycetota bacterium]